MFLANSSLQAQAKNDPIEHLTLGVNYGTGLNMLAESGNSHSARFSDFAVSIGVGSPPAEAGARVELEIGGIWGHDEQTDSVAFLGGSLIVAPLPNLYGRFRYGNDMHAPATNIFGLSVGTEIAVNHWLTNLEVGWVVGEHRDNGYINLFEIRVGFGLNLGKLN